MTHRNALLTWCQSHELAMFCWEITIAPHLFTSMLLLRFAHFLSVFFFPFTYIPACNIFQRLNKLLFKRQHYNSIYTPRFFTKTQYYKVVSKSERICFFFVKYVNIERLLKEKELERLSNALLLSSSPQKGYHSSIPCWLCICAYDYLFFFFFLL